MSKTIEQIEAERYSQLFSFNAGDEERTFEQFTAGLTVEDVKRSCIATGKNSDDSSKGDFKTREFFDLVKKQMQKDGISKANAVRACVRLYPEKHIAFKEEQKRIAEERNMRTSQLKEVSGPESKAFWQAVQERIRDKECSKSEAIRFVVHDQPELHEAFIEAQKRKPETVVA